MKKLFFVLLCLLCSFSANSIYAEYVFKGGKLVKADFKPSMTVVEHYSYGVKAFEKKCWDQAIKHFTTVTLHFPHSPLYQDSLFYLGVSLYHVKEFDMANQKLTLYLAIQTPLKHFEEAYAYKFAIAEQYRMGVKKHLFSSQKLPKWLPAKTEALDLFDEVIAALPIHDLAAKSLYSKAQLLFSFKDYKESIETFQQLIHRFPKHELVSHTYLSISQVYHRQCQSQFHNPDLLDLAKINLRNFCQDYPRSERAKEASQLYKEMQEIYSQGLFDTATLYERQGRMKASVIYYVHAIEKYPDTEAAEKSKERLTFFEDEAEALRLSKEYQK